MGGYNSGFQGPRSDTTMDRLSIDVRGWARKGYLNGHHRFKTWWGADKLKDARHDISIRTSPGQAVLKYRLRAIGADEWRPMKQRIALQYTPCHMGGSRIWFGCPGCDRRCALLYSGETGFYCRKCYDLPYRSQRCGEFDGLLDRRNNLDSRLYGDLSKPMRRKKIDQLIKRLVAANGAVDQFIGKRVPDSWP